MAICLPLIDKDCQERKQMEAESDLMLSQAVLTKAQADAQASTPKGSSSIGLVIGLVLGVFVVGIIIFLIIKKKRK